jgi:hypothetical protein
MRPTTRLNASGSYDLAADTSAEETLTLTGAGRRDYDAASRKHPLNVKLAATLTGGSSADLTATVK